MTLQWNILVKANANFYSVSADAVTSIVAEFEDLNNSDAVLLLVFPHQSVAIFYFQLCTALVIHR